MRVLVLFFLLINISFAKKDFYYSFINSSGSQISQERKQAISDGFDLMQNARILAREGKIDEAYAQIKDFREKNRLRVLQSDLTILYAELSLKKVSKRFITDAAKALEEAINSSMINQDDLAQAYMLLVDLKLESNRAKDARYFANIIVNNFSDELTKTYGKISLAKVYKFQKNYNQAIKTLYSILTKTNDKLVATIVADELFDLYILQKDYEKANKLISDVLRTNIDYYANDSYLANRKINKLINADMPSYAADILIALLNRTSKEESIEDFKFKLANTYMLMYDKTNFYLEKAKELYKDIITDYSKGAYFKRAKMYLDEILMRQGRLKTTAIAAKYESSESMQQKALLQELINDKEDKKFDKILRQKRIYKSISNTIARRFGYVSMNEIFDEVNIERIRELLNQGRCLDLNKALKTSRKETLEKLIKDETIKFKFFECLVEVPYERGFLQVKETFSKSRDANIYLYLERMAYALGFYDDALSYSARVEMVNDKDILAKEFLVRYQIVKAKSNPLSLDKFFSYTKRHEDFININKDNPVILDFYYDYYLYLLKKQNDEKSNEILNKLYSKQKNMKANIYSPFVEMELSRLEKANNNLQKSLDYLLEGVKNTRRLKPNDAVKIYYDILKSYENLGNDIKKEEYLNKCKEVKGTTDSLYKKLCDEM